MLVRTGFLRKKSEKKSLFPVISGIVPGRPAKSPLPAKGVLRAGLPGLTGARFPTFLTTFL